jgi:hypothetical protein
VIALRVKRGDHVRVRGQWQEVKNTRIDRFSAGGPALVLIFKTGPALRVHAAAPLDVRRDRATKREAG